LHDAAASTEAKHCRQIANYLPRRSIATPNNDALSRSSLLVSSGLASSNISNKPFDLAGADLRYPLMPEQGDHVVPQPRHGVGLRTRLHGFALTCPALDEATFSLIKVNQQQDRHFCAFGLPITRGVVAICSRPKQRPRLFSRLLDGERPKAPDCDKASWRGPATTIHSIPDDKGLRPAFLYAEAKPRKVCVPHMVAIGADLSCVDRSLRQQDAR
jgi:hypothetical protein